MRTGGMAIVVASFVGACGAGDAATHADAGAQADGSVAAEDCAGVTGIPSGYPQLGPGCGAHVTLDLHDGLQDADTALDIHGAKGIRPITGVLSGRFVLNIYWYLPHPTDELALIVPSLAPGRYRDEDGAEATRSDIIGREQNSAYEGGGVFVWIDGSTGAAVYGHFAAIACNMPSGDGTCDAFLGGRFAAIVENDGLACDGADPTAAVDCPELAVTVFGLPHPDPTSGDAPEPICGSANDCPTPFTQYITSDPTSPTCSAPICLPPLFAAGREVDATMGVCVCP